ncbi:fumarylacetoacetate hydrolase family protein [Rhodococcus sp. 2H158]
MPAEPGQVALAPVEQAFTDRRVADAEVLPPGSAPPGFGSHNLPYCIFRPGTGEARVGVRLHDDVIDVAAALADPSFVTDSLNPFMAQGPERWAEVRASLRDAVERGTHTEATFPLTEVSLLMPFQVGDYVDFYASEHHASNLGRLLRPDGEPLLPHWKHVPVSYHCRAETVVASGTDIPRPLVRRKPVGSEAPSHGPSQLLDIEVELGFVVGVGSDHGQPVSPDELEHHVFGVVLINDWSARDLQVWEHVPAEPKIGKSFATSISPWVVPLEALRAARIPTPEQVPTPLPHLQGSQDWGLDIDFVVEWNGVPVTRPRYRDMYWSPAQMFAHMTSNGAPPHTGDLFASGAVSGPVYDQAGSFIELTWNGTQLVTLADGQQRTFIEDGDTVTITATTSGPGEPISLGEVTGTVTPCPAPRR